MVQLSHPYMTIGKTIALTSQTFVHKVMSLLFNMLSINFLWQALFSIYDNLYAPKEIRIPDHHTCLQRNLYVDKNATVRTRHKTTDWLVQN